MSPIPFRFQELQKENTFRASQEAVFRLAEKNVDEGRYKEAVVFFERVEHSLHHPEIKEKIRQNIRALLDKIKEKETPPQEKSSPSPDPKTSPETPFPPAMQIKVDNISFSGVEMTGSEKALEVFSKLFSPSHEKEIEKEVEQTADEEIKKIEEKIFKEIRETAQAQGKPALEKTPSETSAEEPAPVPVTTESSKPVLEPAPEKQPEEKKEDPTKSNPFSAENQEPIKVEQVAPKKKLEKVKPLDLTYNFTNVFYSKFYLKYSDIFNEAARLVREKKLDEAIEYYKVLLDQKLPETLKLMIQQNVEDLKLAIINTFKYSDTIVSMDESGKLIRVDDDSIRVLETGGNRHDVYFKEES